MTPNVAHSGASSPTAADASRERDWLRLAEHLRSSGHQFDPSPVPRRFTNGLGNLNYLITFDAAPAVLRQPPPGPVPLGGNDMAREYRILSGLSKVMPLVPRPLHFCADVEVLGSPFLIMEYRPGIVIGGQMPSGLPADAGRLLGNTLVDLLAQLHGIDAEQAGLADLGKPQGFAQRTVHNWTSRAEMALEGMSFSLALDVARWLQANITESGRICILHNDFKLDNVILDPDSLAPNAIIDWDMGTRGDPLFDLGVLMSYWVEANDPAALLALGQMPTHAHGFPSRAEAVARYADRVGMRVDEFVPYRVFGLFRTGVVFLQQHAKQRRGIGPTEATPHGHDHAVLARGLIEVAHDVAHGRLT